MKNLDNEGFIGDDTRFHINANPCFGDETPAEQCISALDINSDADCIELMSSLSNDVTDMEKEENQDLYSQSHKITNPKRTQKNEMFRIIYKKNKYSRGRK